MKLKRLLALAETSVRAFAISPWSSAALWTYGASWVFSEAMRGKGIGWDGVITLILGEVALATLRKK